MMNSESNEARVTGTNIYWMARGCWSSYFSWRISSIQAEWLIICVCALALLTASSIFSAAVFHGQSVPALLPILEFVLLIAVVVSVMIYAISYIIARDDYIHYWVVRWEKGDHSRLPDTDSIVKFIEVRSRKVPQGSVA